MTAYDVVTLGETMLRLMPPGHQRLEQASALEIEIGGSESNTAVGLARLGLRVAWLSRLPDNSLGRRVARTLAVQGVDVSHVVWAEGERLGVYFVEAGAPPRDGQVIYDRRDSALSRMRPDDLPAEVFRPQGARRLHLTGITPALSAPAAATARGALDLARAASWPVSFDLNYRGRLWPPEVARDGCEPFARAADLLIAPVRDARTLYGLASDATPESALDFLSGRFPQAAVVLTLGEAGALGREPGGPAVHQPAHAAQAVDRIGAGDAFAAGLLYGRLQSGPGQPGWLAEALRWGTAMAALKYTIHGDLPLIDRAEVEGLMAGAGGEARIKR